MAIDVNKHNLVPKHSKASEAEKKKLFTEYNISGRELPKILIEDPAIVKLNVKVGDIVKIERDSKTAKTASYYRMVVEG